MPKYKIEWENELYNCDNPLEAVKECAKDIANGESSMFTVTDLVTGKKFSVDLSEEEEDAVIEMKG